VQKYFKISPKCPEKIPTHDGPRSIHSEKEDLSNQGCAGKIDTEHDNYLSNSKSMISNGIQIDYDVIIPMTWQDVVIFTFIAFASTSVLTPSNPKTKNTAVKILNCVQPARFCLSQTDK
jgi:hypothetical protein